MTASPLLEIKNLLVSPSAFGRDVVNNVSLSVARGEVLALIGESGSGKTTLALSSLGRIRPGLTVRGGNVLLDGRDLISAPASELRRLRGRTVAYIAQSAAMSFNQRMRLDRQVTEPAHMHDAMPAMQAVRRAHDLYRKLGLPYPETIGARYPHQVSGGQLQRFMIAMGLLLQPDLVVCDEPTSALDVTTQVEVLRALKAGILEHGTAALFVSHDLAVVAQVADRIAVLKKGDLIECGTTAEILHDAKHAYTRELIAACRRWPISAGSFSSTRAGKPAAEAHLAAENIVAGFGSVLMGKPAVQILNGVSLEVKRGQVLAVIGESGSGKSTLARVIAGLHPQASGELKLPGKVLARGVAKRSRDELRRVQMVFQSADTALNSKHTVGRILERVLRFFGHVPPAQRPARIAALLEMVRLPAEYAHRRPGQLSGGEKQRVNLARALAAEPEVLLCDEITSALDTVVAASIVSLIEDLRDRLDLAIVFISHDMATVAALADEVIVLKQGSVVERGATREVLSLPQSAYTRLLLDSVPELRAGWLEDTAPTPLPAGQTVGGGATVAKPTLRAHCA
ncbi:ABC transporter ATP-binding protein [Mesorhizobium sp. B2-6-5]|uniref:ABC transporter ATP-binding protein n=1 Tax=Mesorhizobium sp. B2-6-5 TaxID=2589912 RepID=UPI001129B963|nr:ABC transporter ATP-binding protein [Mesorhizobium sp. B2-6-5]TPJ33481.1 ABC transporter ATP-binding protein [Mesorhizobium sp. B2-6-5]